MDINQLFSYVDGKQGYSKDSIELFKSTLEENPYFQAAHILLLKSLYINEINNYNSQLKISGTYISDKIKLFQFINKDVPEISVSSDKKEIKKEEAIDIKKEKTPEERIQELKEKNLNKKRDKKLKPNEIKKETDKKTEKKEVETNIQNKKEKINAELRHTKIINDFFKSTKTIKKAKGEKNKIEPVKKEKTEIINQSNNEVTAKSLFEENKRKKEIIEKKTKNTGENNNFNKTLIEKAQLVKKVAPTKKPKITKPIEKKVEIVNTKKTIETPKPIIKKEEAKKENVPIKKNAQTNAMNNIFSKIKAIKKEMNIDSDKSNKKIIDINKVEPSKIKKLKDKAVVEEKKIIFKNDVFNETDEAIDPFKQKTEKKEITKNNLNTTKEEKTPKIENKEIIKEETVTAKDLFNRHQKNKTLETVKNYSEKGKGIKSFVDEYIKEPTQVEKNNKLYLQETKKEKSIIKKTATNKKESAADILLKRIALKKQKMKEEENEKKIETKNKTNNIEENDEFEIDKKSIDNIKKIKEANNLISSNETKTVTNTKKNEENQVVKSTKSNNLIDKFINKSENLERLGNKDSKLKGDISIDSSKENDEIITEFIADLYIQQKNYKKAISAYEKLILKFPEKKTYFAIQIKKVESFIK